MYIDEFLMDEHQTDKPKLPRYNSCVMTPEEFQIRMLKLHDNDDIDIEERHILMDKLMCDLLIDLGYWEGIHIFNNTEMWYAQLRIFNTHHNEDLEKGIIMKYENFSSKALLDMAFVESLKEDKTEYNAIMEEINRRTKPKKDDEDFWF